MKRYGFKIDSFIKKHFCLNIHNNFKKNITKNSLHDLLTKAQEAFKAIMKAIKDNKCSNIQNNFTRSTE